MVAKELAGDRDVAVTAGNVGGQALALELVNEVAMDVVPVVFGRGKRYFGALDAQQLLEDSHVVIQGRRVLHPRYRVRADRHSARVVQRVPLPSHARSRK